MCGYCVVIRIAVSAENNCIIFLIKYRSFLQWKKSSSEQCEQGEEGKGVLSHSGVLVVAAVGCRGVLLTRLLVISTVSGTKGAAFPTSLHARVFQCS